MKSHIKNYLSVTKKEWNGLVILVLLIVMVTATPYVYQLFHKDTTINFKDFDAAVAMLNKARANQPKSIAGKATFIPLTKAAPGEIIELNAADSARLTALHGVGPSFAKRIVRYRQRLGGFYQKEQLREVFGLDSGMYTEISKQVSVNPTRIKKININTATFDILSHFPYLSYKQMNAIIQFRTEHGEYGSIADMRNVAILDPGTLNKIKPYLKFK